MSQYIKKVWIRLKNSLVFKNYSYMTIAQIVGVIASLCIYPYAIRKLGAESYGMYVFALSIMNYFAELISFGVKYPATKGVVENIDNEEGINRLVSCVYGLKTCLSVVSWLIFICLLCFIPSLREKSIILLLIFIQVFVETLSPHWFYQGKQKMQVVTIIQVSARLLSIPFIYIFVKSPKDIVIFCIISTLFITLGAIVCFVLLFAQEKVRFVKISFKEIVQLIKDSLPFFGSNVMSTIKNETASVLIGSFIGMSEVAIYDLASKVVAIPRTLTQNINQALFPDVLGNNRNVKKIIKYEYLIGLAVIVLIAIVGYPTIYLLGGASMVGAFPVSIILSVSILTWLVAGAYIGFVFVPTNYYRLTTWNQLVALLSFLLIAIIGCVISPNIYILAIAFAVSGLCELIYCRIVTHYYNLL